MQTIVHHIKRAVTETVKTGAKVDYKVLHEYELLTTTPLSTLVVRWNCPFAGNDAGGSRSAIQLRLDDDVLTRTMKFNSQSWELHPLVIDAVAEDVSDGPHAIVIEAKVNKGNMHLPHYHSGDLEGDTGLDVTLVVLEIPQL